MSEIKFEPQIVCFCCRFSWGFAEAEKELLQKGGHLVPMVCSGKIDATYLSQAFMKGADGVLVLGCLEDDCHFQDGNIEFKKRTVLFRKVLQAFGIEESRVRYLFGLDADGQSIAQIMAEFSADLQKMGPSLILKPQQAALAWNV